MGVGARRLMNKGCFLAVIALAGAGLMARPARAWDDEHQKPKAVHHRDPFKHHRHETGHGTHPAVAHHHAHAAGTAKPVKHEMARHESPKRHAKVAKQEQAQ
jgi:hypothetical protein